MIDRGFAKQILKDGGVNERNKDKGGITHPPSFFIASTAFIICYMLYQLVHLPIPCTAPAL